jgi:hypothetical protein
MHLRLHAFDKLIPSLKGFDVSSVLPCAVSKKFTSLFLKNISFSGIFSILSATSLTTSLYFLAVKYNSAKLTMAV